MLQLIARRSLHSQALAKSFGFCPLDIPKPAASPRGLTQLLESWIGNLHAVTELVWESPPQLPWNKELIGADCLPYSCLGAGRGAGKARAQSCTWTQPHSWAGAAPALTPLECCRTSQDKA